MSDPRARTRNKQVRRVIQEIAYLQRGYWSVRGLAEKLGVSPRTVQRDFAALRYDKVALKHDWIGSAWTLR